MCTPLDDLQQTHATRQRVTGGVCALREAVRCLCRESLSLQTRARELERRTRIRRPEHARLPLRGAAHRSRRAPSRDSLPAIKDAPRITRPQYGRHSAARCADSRPRAHMWLTAAPRAEPARTRSDKRVVSAPDACPIARALHLGRDTSVGAGKGRCFSATRIDKDAPEIYTAYVRTPMR